jgi:hypothetical protein
VLRYGSFRKSTKSFEAPPIEVVRDERFDVAMVSAIEVKGERVAVQISDLSERGIGGRSSVPLSIGEEAQVTLPQIGTVPVQIRWALGGRFGARFLVRVNFTALTDAPAQPAAL